MSDSYYIVDAYNGHILEAFPSCPEAQELADFWERTVYIIKGHRIGPQVKPTTPPQSPDDKTG